MKFIEIFSDIITNAGIAHGFLFAAILYGGHKNKNSRLMLSLLLVNLSLIVFRIQYLNPYLMERFGPFYGSGPYMPHLEDGRLLVCPS